MTRVGQLSRSVGHGGSEIAQELLEAAGRFKGAEVRTGLLAFGRAPEWESLRFSSVAGRRSAPPASI